MKKVKLPRKRKKAYIKAKGRVDYRMIRLLTEIGFEEGENNNRFYSYKYFKGKGYVISKKW